MHFSIIFLVIALNVGHVFSAALHDPRGPQNRAAYFLDNDPAGDSIVALDIADADGKLSAPVRTPTGGKGLAGLVAVSQDSVVVSENYLFTINPGDHTISMFIIDDTDPTHPKLVGEPQDTLGLTPISVAYSPKIKTGKRVLQSPIFTARRSLMYPVCVGNAGTTAGVTCFSVDFSKGLSPQGGLRLVPQSDFTNSTTPPAGPLTIISQVAFNPSETALFLTAHSNGGQGAQPSLIYAWPVQDGKVATESVVSSFPEITFAFSLNFLGDDNRFFITNPHLANPGAAILDVSYPSLQITIEKIIQIPKQIASCWCVYAPQFDSLFVFDAVQPNITILDDNTGDLRSVFHFDPTQRGGVDAMAQRSWLYSLTNNQTDPKINVFNIEGSGSGKTPTLVQAYDLFKGLGTFPAWMGLDVYPSQRD